MQFRTHLTQFRSRMPHKTGANLEPRTRVEHKGEKHAWDANYAWRRRAASYDWADSLGGRSDRDAQRRRDRHCSKRAID